MIRRHWKRKLSSPLRDLANRSPGPTERFGETIAGPRDSLRVVTINSVAIEEQLWLLIHGQGNAVTRLDRAHDYVSGTLWMGVFSVRIFECLHAQLDSVCPTRFYSLDQKGNSEISTVDDVMSREGGIMETRVSARVD